MSGITPPILSAGRHDFADQVAIVTGAAQGIGEAYARALAAAGAWTTGQIINVDGGQVFRS
jgi:predicted Rossmann-fold nucleotide-binding protein